MKKFYATTQEKENRYIALATEYLKAKNPQSYYIVDYMSLIDDFEPFAYKAITDEKRKELEAEIAKVEAYDLLVYIQKEVWLSNDGGMDYQRSVGLLKDCMCEIEQCMNCQNELTYEIFESIGLTDDEIAEFGFDYVLNNEEEE